MFTLIVWKRFSLTGQSNGCLWQTSLPVDKLYCFADKKRSWPVSASRQEISQMSPGASWQNTVS